MHKTKLLIGLGIAIAGLTLSLEAAESSVLNEKLKPIEFLIGNWEGNAIAQNGQEATWKIACKPDLGGSVIFLSFEILDKQLATVYSQRNTYYWQEQTKTMAAASFSSRGEYVSDVLVKQAENRFIWQGTGSGGDGKIGTILTELDNVDNNTMSVQVTHLIIAGEPHPTGPKVTLKRVQSSRVDNRGKPPVYAVRLMTLRQGTTPESFERFVKEEFNEICKNDFGGVRFSIMKADRGENKGKYALLWEFASTGVRARYYPEEDKTPPDEAQKAADQALKPAGEIMTKLDRFVEIESKYTDFVPLR